MRLAMNFTGLNVISLNRGIAMPRTMQAAAPMALECQRAKTAVSRSRNTGHSHEGKILRSGRAKAMTPGKKFGMYNHSVNQARPGIAAGTCRNSPQTNQIASSFQKDRFFHRNRKGRNKYI